MDQNEQTQSAFSAPNRRDAYLRARAETPEQKGLSYTDLLFDNIFGLDNEYESTGETLKKALREDPYGTLGGVATSAYEGAVDFVRNPYEGVKGIFEDTVGSIKRVATEDLDEKLNRMYGVSYEEATPDQVTKAREVVASDVMTVAGVIPVVKGVGLVAKGGAKLAKGAGALAKGAVDALPEAAQAARKFIPDESGSLPLGKSVPASRQKVPTYLIQDTPTDPTNPKQTFFRSAIPEVLEKITFPKKGLDGYQIIAELQKNPSLRKAELDTVLEEFDPKARYSKDKASEIISKNTWNVAVNKRYDHVEQQRQTELLDPEIGYVELTLDATRPNMFKSNIKKDDLHYVPETIAHTRVSFRRDTQEGYDYALVEENQSDLLQQGFVEPRKTSPLVTPSNAVDNLFRDLPEDFGFDDTDKELLKILGEDGRPAYFNPESYKKFIASVGADNLLDTSNPPASLLGMPKEDIVLDYVLNQRDRTSSETLLDLYAQFKYPKDTNGKAEDYKDSLIDLYQSKIKGKINYRETVGISAPPIKKIEETVRMTMDALIAESATKGITRIVMPPFERIVDKRFPKDKEPEAYARAIDPSSGFYKTYITSFQKYLKDAEEEFGRGNFNARLKDLDYSDPDYLPTTGTEIDFTGLYNSGYDFSKPKFAEGGMVEEEQMNRLMQEGGMADDGMSREPVTGNDIPPGALASEVRDNVDAKLSGGEYVVPADVLRYYGVRFFEDLRAQAKQGMMEMESAGRIGGVPVDPRGVPMQGQDEELTPEEEQMLAQAMSSTSGMAEGGDVFNRGDFTMTSNAMTSKLYFNPTTGKKQTINFLGDKPLGGIPDGFVPWTQALQDSYDATKPATPTKPKKRSPYNDDDEPVATNSYDEWADENYEAITNDPFKFGMDLLKTPNDDGGVLGILTGKDRDILNVAGANAALKRLEAQGKVNSPEYVALAEEVKKYVGGLSLVERGLLASGVVGMGNQYDAALERKAGETPPPAAPVVNPPAPAASPSNDTLSGGDDQAATGGGTGSDDLSGGDSRDNDRDRQAGSSTPPTTTTPPTSTTTTTNTGNNPGNPNAVGYNPPAPAPAPKPPLTRFQASQYTSLAEGGLVSKPKKTRAKTKGLAGKQ